MYEVGIKLGNAVSRCEYIAACEQVLGYEESWRTYADLAIEIKVARTWISDEMRAMLIKPS
jgi:hypothetical protein